MKLKSLFDKKDNTEYITENMRNFENKFSTKDIVGKKVFSKSGEFVGVVDDLVFDAKEIIGLYIKGTYFTYIDLECCKLNSQKYLLLKLDPVTNLVGKKVFDKNGEYVGKTIGLQRKTYKNDFNSIIVKKNLFSHAVVIYKSQIMISKENIILNISIQEIK